MLTRKTGRWEGGKIGVMDENGKRLMVKLA